MENREKKKSNALLVVAIVGVAVLVVIGLIVGILILLGGGSALAFRGIQNNARIAVANIEASELARTLNTHNSMSPENQITTSREILNFVDSNGQLTLPATGHDFTMYFESYERAREVTDWITFNGVFWETDFTAIERAH